MAERLANATGSLADGAERLERLIRGVKDRQFSEALNAPQPKSVSSAYAVSQRARCVCQSFGHVSLHLASNATESRPRG